MATRPSAQVHRRLITICFDQGCLCVRRREYEDLSNKDLIELGLARTTTFPDACCREFERLREEAEERGAGL
jgi:hypothetical protein